VIKGPEALEASGSIDTVVLDKTGTLTTGEMVVESVTPITAADEASETADRVRSLAAAVETHSEHPIGRAIAGELDDRPVVSDFAALAGLGAAGTVDGQRILVGNRALLNDHGVPTPDRASDAVEAAEQEGKTAVLVAADDRVIGVLVLSDRIKPSAAESVAALKNLRLRTVLLTGDNIRAAESVGSALGVDQVIAGVLPTGKAAVIEELQADGHKVAMVGDGINDATALATADLGLAVLHGTDIALKSADVILVRQHLGVIADAIGLARKTLRTIQGNLVWAFGYNIAAIPLAAFGLLNPLIAGAAMSLSSVFVVTNSLRLKSFRSHRLASTDDQPGL
jgi:Cu+-exporting ATPase